MLWAGKVAGEVRKDSLTPTVVSFDSSLNALGIYGNALSFSGDSRGALFLRSTLATLEKKLILPGGCRIIGGIPLDPGGDFCQPDQGVLEEIERRVWNPCPGNTLLKYWVSR